MSALVVLMLLLNVMLACGFGGTSLPTVEPIPGWKPFQTDDIELWLPES
jgi:hypothetical protein